MADISKPCDFAATYNNNQDAQSRHGFVNKMTIAGTALDADQSINSPEDGKGIVKVVGVMGQFFWAGGATDPLQITMEVSADNKQKIDTMLHQEMKGTEVLIEFDLWEYDPKSKKYFNCVHCNGTDLKCLILKSGSSLDIYMSDAPDSSVPEPENFQLQIGLMPQREEQDIHYAVSETGKFAKKWGVTVG